MTSLSRDWHGTDIHIHIGYRGLPRVHKARHYNNIYGRRWKSSSLSEECCSRKFYLRPPDLRWLQSNAAVERSVTVR